MTILWRSPPSTVSVRGHKKIIKSLPGVIENVKTMQEEVLTWLHRHIWSEASFDISLKLMRTCF